jgi:uncharacterized membrane protein
MEGARKRSLVKSVVWRVICIVVSVFTTFFLTGRWDLAVAVGSIYNAVTMVLYYFHERIWNRIKWGMNGIEKVDKPRNPEQNLEGAASEMNKIV